MQNLLFALPHLTYKMVPTTMVRLLLAAVLGGSIGIERELRRRPAGLRTNMFICFGSAMFTVLSTELASEWGIGDHTRIAAQIIPGIGFIGAGSILHAKGSVTGLTTAATIFVVASIGMACGGGLYLTAIFATILILLGLLALGWLERKFSLKPLYMNFSIVTEKPAEDVVEQVNGVLEELGKHMQAMRLTKANGKRRLVFSVDGTMAEHRQLLAHFREFDDLRDTQATPGLEID